jgi:penicillin-insensitive murein endopeptidase
MARSMLRDPFTVDAKLWTPLHTKLIKRAASYPEVERIFVHPAIKQVLCEQAGADRIWLSKVRPWWGLRSSLATAPLPSPCFDLALR